MADIAAENNRKNHCNLSLIQSAALTITQVANPHSDPNSALLCSLSSHSTLQQSAYEKAVGPNQAAQQSEMMN